MTYKPPLIGVPFHDPHDQGATHRYLLIPRRAHRRMGGRRLRAEGPPAAMSYQRYKLVIFAAATEGSVLLLALMLSRWLSIPLTPLTTDFFRDVLIGTAGAVPPFILFSFLISDKATVIPGIRDLRDVLRGPIRDLFHEATVVDLVGIALLAGFAEECLFHAECCRSSSASLPRASFSASLISLRRPISSSPRSWAPTWGCSSSTTGSLLAVIHLPSSTTSSPWHTSLSHEVAFSGKECVAHCRASLQRQRACPQFF
ncbi:MAG: hypothetical protein MZV70_59650 [Desulfobacterales bacterium]|nr:hypothetical protein [Desulfobacterales bacterium]